jgi:uracil-DNA glycosylase
VSDALPLSDARPRLHTQRLARGNDIREWSAAAIALIRARCAPQQVVWEIGQRQTDLFAAHAHAIAIDAAPANPAPWPPEFDRLARRAICHRDGSRHAILYRIAWRLARDPNFLDRVDEPDVALLARWEREVSRAAHKMKAFVRFQRDAADHYHAWFDPGHPLLQAVAPFFARRFASMRWTIITPDARCTWDGRALQFGPGSPRPAERRTDDCEDLWKTYYSNIFNPARLKTAAMVREMPRRYWRDLPEAPLIPDLVSQAKVRTGSMVDDARRVHAVQEQAAGCHSLTELNAAVAGCRACPAGCQGTQAVPGEGAMGARIMLVGEQPGDQEERAGRPFTGPAGALLEELLDAAGLRRSDLYVTNAVKHFSFRERGTQRLHKSPTRTIIEHCRWWVLRERELVSPRVVVPLGRTASTALQMHGTFHPAYLLREPDAERREAARQHVVAALQRARVSAGPTPPARVIE